VPKVKGLVLGRNQSDGLDRLRRIVLVEEKQLHARGASGKEGKIDAVRQNGRAQGMRRSGLGRSGLGKYRRVHRPLPHDTNL
jgi:hypothetical protein